MLSFRERVLEPFFEEAKINTRAYYDRKDLRRGSPRASFGYDTADQIIIDIARGLRKEPSLFNTFGYLYHCHKREEVQEELAYRLENGKFKPLERSTVMRYEKKIIKFIHAQIRSDLKIEKDLIETIREEYEKGKN